MAGVPSVECFEGKRPSDASKTFYWYKHDSTNRFVLPIGQFSGGVGGSKATVDQTLIRGLNTAGPVVCLGPSSVSKSREFEGRERSPTAVAVDDFLLLRGNKPLDVVASSRAHALFGSTPSM